MLSCRLGPAVPSSDVGPFLCGSGPGARRPGFLSWTPIYWLSGPSEQPPLTLVWLSDSTVTVNLHLSPCWWAGRS